MAIVAAFASRVIVNAFAPVAVPPTVTEYAPIPCERMLLEESWAETVRLSLPGGSLIVSVQVHGPLAPPVHVALLRVTANMPRLLVLNDVTCAALRTLEVFSVKTIFDVDDDT